jgi:hypothetical protein
MKAFLLAILVLVACSLSHAATYNQSTPSNNDGAVVESTTTLFISTATPFIKDEIKPAVEFDSSLASYPIPCCGRYCGGHWCCWRPACDAPLIANSTALK